MENANVDFRIIRLSAIITRGTVLSGSHEDSD